MSFAEELRNIRRHCFLSQEAFARELNVSRPSFCDRQNIDFSALEKEWREIGKEENND